LKRKKVSSDKVDPDLNQGCAYFVEEREYKEYLVNYKEETEPVRPSSSPECNVRLPKSFNRSLLALDMTPSTYLKVTLIANMLQLEWEPLNAPGMT
jgi:hypothetical protein